MWWGANSNQLWMCRQRQQPPYTREVLIISLLYIYVNPGLLYPWLKDLIIALSTNYVLIIYI